MAQKCTYSKFELQRAVFAERNELIKERCQLVRRLGWIEGRLADLDKAEDLLAGFGQTDCVSG